MWISNRAGSRDDVAMNRERIKAKTDRAQEMKLMVFPGGKIPVLELAQ
jgi:phosphosulfolactate synthase (CoM biosynthesis protein A)